MSDATSQPAPAPKRVIRYVHATMDPETRAAAGLRHVTTIERWRITKEAKKQVVGDFNDKLEEFDEQAKALERATRARDGEDVQLPMPCKEVPLYREEHQRWELAVYQLNVDPLTGEETDVFHAWEDLPEEFAHLNQGKLFRDKDGGDKGPGKGGDGKGPSDRDAVRDVDFPDEEEDAQEERGAGDKPKGGKKRGGGK